MTWSNFVSPRFLATSTAVVLLMALTIVGWTATSRKPAQAQASCLPSSLKTRLAQIRKRFGPVRIISIRRPHARISGTRFASYHSRCKAVDFIPPKGKYNAVANWLRANHRGGVGTYSCGMRHIHIDAGPYERWNYCISGGQIVPSRSSWCAPRESWAACVARGANRNRPRGINAHYYGRGAKR